MKIILTTLLLFVILVSPAFAENNQMKCVGANADGAQVTGGVLTPTPDGTPEGKCPEPKDNPPTFRHCELPYWFRSPNDHCVETKDQIQYGHRTILIQGDGLCTYKPETYEVKKKICVN